MGYWFWVSKKDDKYCIHESMLIDLSNGTMGNFELHGMGDGCRTYVLWIEQVRSLQTLNEENL